MKKIKNKNAARWATWDVQTIFPIAFYNIIIRGPVSKSTLTCFPFLEIM